MVFATDEARAAGRIDLRSTFVLLAFLASLQLPAFAQSPSPNAAPAAERNPAAEAGDRLVTALGGDAAARRAFVESAFSSGALASEPAAQRAAALDRLVQDAGRIRLVQAHVRGARHADLVLATERGRFITAVIFTSGREAGKISGLFFLPTRDPARTAAEAWPDSGVPRDRLSQEIAWRIAAQEQDDFFYGAVLVARGDEILFRRGYGYADIQAGRRNTAQTQFTSASIGKMFTSVAILALVDRGAISLDDRLSRWVPDYPHAAGATITLRQLLTHTSGIGEWAAQFRPHASQRAAAATMVEPPSGEPGARMSYSNANYVLLGAVIEAATGKSLDEALRELVFNRANMNATTLASGADVGTGALRYHFAEDDPVGFRGYRPDLANHQLRADASGGAYTTVDDLLAFHRALYQGRLLSPQRTRDMLAPVVDFPGTPRPSRYGYGIRFSSCGERQAFGHSGGGPNAGVSNATYATADGEWTVIVLSNTNAAGEELAITLCEAVSRSRS